ncbi:MAG TPA: protein kinase [Anaerolineae bacterium]|nr:protein kinase [Anaerolineae bacterium]
MSELLGRVLGNYHILEQIGRGGMASVYKAHDLTGKQTVAIKVLSPQLAMQPNFRTRFEREAEVLRGLKHPNIVPILDYGEEGGLAYIVMPFMEVGTLSDCLEGGHLTLEQAARIINQVTSALQYAHDNGVIHRDVKPSNILIDEGGNAWLSDFGFAHVHDATLSLTGSALIGTPAYMAPEIVSGNPVSPHSDQYSLAVVVYHLTTGRLPFDGETPMAIALSHVTTPVPRPRKVNPEVSRSIEVVLLKALAKDPSYRFDSIADFNRTFQEAVELEQDRTEVREGGSLFERTALILDEVQAEVKHTALRVRFSHVALVVGVLLLFLILPAAVTDLFGFLQADAGPSQVAALPTSLEDLQATINALNTELAPGTGTPWSQGQLETSVAETMSAMQDFAVETDDQIQIATWTTTMTATKDSSGGSTRYSTPTKPPQPRPTSTQPPSHTPTPTVVLSPTITRTDDEAPSTTDEPTVTATAVESQTPTIMPSSTPTSVPPTPDPCAGIALFDFSIGDHQVRWRLNNDSTANIRVSMLRVYWPSSNVELERVRFESATIWNDGSTVSPTDIGGINRSVDRNASKRFTFYFDEDAAGSGYQLTVNLTNGCSVTANH